MENPKQLRDIEEQAAHNFKFVDPIQDRRTLQRITLDACIDLPFMQTLDDAIHLGSHKLHYARSTLSEMRTTRYWRAKTITLLGIDRPNHTLHDAWKKAGVGYDIVSSRLYNTLITLDGLSRGKVVEVVQKAPLLLNKQGETISLQFNYLGRVASFFAWHKDIETLAIEQPQILVTPLSSLRLLARIALHHGTPELRDISPEELTSIIAHRSHTSIETHLLAILQKDDDYLFGMTSSRAGMTHPTKAAVRNCLLKTINPNKPIIHPEVLDAYFRFFAPSAFELKNMPHIAEFLGRIDPHILVERPKPKTVKGHEHWLTVVKPSLNMLAPKSRATWLRALNRVIEIGSRGVHKAPLESDEYEEVANARNTFFEMLGWARPSHIFFPKYSRCLANYGGLIPPPPIRTVEILNVLEKHNMDIERTLSAFFSITICRADRIERKINIIKNEGFDPAKIKVGLLRASDGRLIAELQAMRISQSGG